MATSGVMRGRVMICSFAAWSMDGTGNRCFSGQEEATGVSKNAVEFYIGGQQGSNVDCDSTAVDVSFFALTTVPYRATLSHKSDDGNE